MKVFDVCVSSEVLMFKVVFFAFVRAPRQSTALA
jgi:hypothetical protein